jgi:hypothetical protein
MLSVNYRMVVERTSTAVTLFSSWVRTGTSTSEIVGVLLCIYLLRALPTLSLE